MAANSAAAHPRRALDRLLTSSRAQRRLTVVSAVVLLAGIVAFSVAFIFHDTAAHTNDLSVTPPPPASGGKHVTPSKDAKGVAREFLETAVVRKNLHLAYTLVGPPLKLGVSRKQWESGNNQVIPYPANNERTARFNVISSTKSRLYLTVQLSAIKTSGLDAYTFYMLLRKVHGKWLVYYFEAECPTCGVVPNGGGAGN